MECIYVFVFHKITGNRRNGKNYAVAQYFAIKKEQRGVSRTKKRAGSGRRED